MNPGPTFELSDNAVDRLLRNAMRDTLVAGILGGLALFIGSGWRNAAMLMTGTLISAASIFEWKRLAGVMRAALDQNKIPRSAPAVVIFFVIRLAVYGAAIYVSLKCFQGSTVALLCGLGLAALAIGWEALRLLLT